jgi:hypothetical protein
MTEMADFGRLLAPCRFVDSELPTSQASNGAAA